MPGSDKPEPLELPDEIIEHIKNLNPVATVSKKPMEAIADNIDPNSDAGQHVMGLVGEYLSPTKVTDLGLVQTILSALNAQIHTEFQIGKIKECVEQNHTTTDNDDLVITSQVTYYDYSVFRNALGDLDIQENERQLILKSVLRDGYIACNFNIAQYSLLCRLKYNVQYDQNVQDIKEFLTANNEFEAASDNDSIKLSVRFDSKLSGLTKPAIQKQGDKNQYPVLQTIALILKAASMVKASNYEAFVVPFTNNLASFDHPNILCTI